MARNNRYNTRNPRSRLYRQLTRLMSGPIVNWRVQAQRKVSKVQTDKWSTKYKSVSGQQFKRSTQNPYDYLQINLLSNQNRNERHVDFDQMEYLPELATALDIYADEITTHSELQPLLMIQSPNEELKQILHNLYYNIMNIEYNLFGWARTMCKYGDLFLYLDLDESSGITNVIPLPSNDIERLEGEDKTNPNYVQFQWNSAGMTLENWQVAHFRNLGNDKYAPYGTSVLDPARRIFRQLILMEDAMMSYRIVRSPERRVFYLDVGGVAPQDVEQTVHAFIKEMKKNQIVSDTTGRVDLRYNPMSVEEDFFLPVRGDTKTRIETLPGGQFTGDIDDVKYLRDKLFSAIKIPASYLASGDEVQEDKTTLAQKDVRFARTIQRLQRSVISEMEKIGLIHLYTLGYRGDDLTKFKIHLNNPSKIAEMQELEFWKLKFEVASSATEGHFSRRWISDNIFNLSYNEYIRNTREMFTDKKNEAMLNAVADATAQIFTQSELSGFDEDGLGDLAGDLTDDELENIDFESDPGEVGGMENDDILLASPDDENDTEGSDMSPGKRKDDIRVYEKSSYRPEKRDKRRDSGPRRRNIKGKYAGELASSTSRNLFKGASELKSLTRGIYEGRESNYNDKEYSILTKKRDIDMLIEKLDIKLKSDNDETQ